MASYAAISKVLIVDDVLTEAVAALALTSKPIGVVTATDLDSFFRWLFLLLWGLA
jgi:ABC-type cobalamin transport system permease subunit